MKRKTIYLDHAAATPLDKRAARAMEPYWAREFYNPSALYTPARRVNEALNEARHQVAQVLGAKQNEIIFTAGATESINLAILGIAKLFSGKKIVVSAIEHEAVAAAARQAGKVEICPVGPSGLVDLEKLTKLIDDETVLVSIQYANNEVGTIQPLRDIGRIIEKVRADRARQGVELPIYLHTDASQAANYLDLHADQLGVDLMSLNGGKIYGPKQTGCLYVASGVELAPLVHGGGQERGLRAGTENVPGFVGFSEALAIAARIRRDESQRLTWLRDALAREIKAALPDTNINGGMKHRLPNNLNLTIPGVNGETLVHHLDQAGILVATGAACSGNRDQPSHVLLAIGLAKEEVNSSIRLTLGRDTTEEDIGKVARVFPEVVAQVREIGLQ